MSSRRRKNEENVAELQLNVYSGNPFLIERLHDKPDEDILKVIKNLMREKDRYIEFDKDLEELNKDIKSLESLLELRYILNDIERVKRGEEIDEFSDRSKSIV